MRDHGEEGGLPAPAEAVAGPGDDQQVGGDTGR